MPDRKAEIKIMDTKQISIADFNYELPEERIAKFPVTPRDHSRLLVAQGEQIVDEHFFNLAQYLPAGALMVFNNTKVIHARLHFRKATGALIEVFLLEPYAPAEYEQIFLTRGKCSWLCLIGNQKKWKEGTLQASLPLEEGTLHVEAVHEGSHDTSQIITFTWHFESSGVTPSHEWTFAEVLEACGELPIPPYLNRRTQESDLTTYQTVYSKIKGSVAAPTAGLHFTPQVLESLDRIGIDREELTLHVGAGTFKPVKSEQMGQHVMHTEHVCVHRQTLEKLLSHDCQAIAVGTTSVRTLESLFYMGLKVENAKTKPSETFLHVSQWEPYDQFAHAMHPSREQVRQSISALLGWLDSQGMTELHGSTQIIIAPGYDFKIVNHLLTNFHQPQSTLLLLVSAFTHGGWRRIYDHALSSGYRFLSYGDSSLLTF